MSLPPQVPLSGLSRPFFVLFENGGGSPFFFLVRKLLCFDLFSVKEKEDAGEGGWESRRGEGIARRESEKRVKRNRTSLAVVSFRFPRLTGLSKLQQFVPPSPQETRALVLSCAASVLEMVSQGTGWQRATRNGPVGRRREGLSAQVATQCNLMQSLARSLARSSGAIVVSPRPLCRARVFRFRHASRTSRRALDP